MAKEKRKLAQKFFPEYLINEFILFSHEFAYELDLAPRQAINQLKAKLFPDAVLTIQKSGSKKYKVFHVTSDTGNFRIAEAEGEIYEDNGITQIQYKVKVLSGIWILLFAVVFICNISALFNNFNTNLVVTTVLVGIAALGLWIYSIHERNQLIKLMKTAISKAASEPQEVTQDG